MLWIVFLTSVRGEVVPVPYFFPVLSFCVLACSALMIVVASVHNGFIRDVFVCGFVGYSPDQCLFEVCDLAVPYSIWSQQDP